MTTLDNTTTTYIIWGYCRVACFRLWPFSGAAHPQGLRNMNDNHLAERMACNIFTLSVRNYSMDCICTMHIFQLGNHSYTDYQENMGYTYISFVYLMFCTYMYICVYTSTVLLTIKDELFYCIFFCLSQCFQSALFYSCVNVFIIINLANPYWLP